MSQRETQREYVARLESEIETLRQLVARRPEPTPSTVEDALEVRRLRQLKEMVLGYAKEPEEKQDKLQEWLKETFRILEDALRARQPSEEAFVMPVDDLRPALKQALANAERAPEPRGGADR